MTDPPLPPTVAPAGETAVVRIDPPAVPAAILAGLESGAVLAPANVAVFAVGGRAAVACMQGLLTNDLEKPGDGAFVYGALLTPKGMIVIDGWAARAGPTVTYTVPSPLRGRTAALLARAIPPRLARVADHTEDVSVFRLAGPRALVVAAAAGLAVPEAPGTRLLGGLGEVARAPDGAPFVLQITTPAAQAAGVVAAAQTAGALLGDGAILQCARILAGWPEVGAEVDDKTIPQEVRYDQIGGVSYTKGCYTGQETVSRLHFRGHANRHLLGLLFDAAPAPGIPEVRRADRDVGRVSSVLWVPAVSSGTGGRWIGLAVLRREVEPGAVVLASGCDARVVALPFARPIPSF